MLVPGWPGPHRERIDTSHPDELLASGPPNGHHRYRMNTDEVPTPTGSAAPPSAADRVYEHTRAAILDGRLADHEIVSEGSLAEATGVSRTPVREALLRLEAQGMVRLIPKRGALVLPVTAGEWRDVLDTRRLVERHGATAALAAGQGPALAGRLQGHLQRLAAAADDGDLAEYVAADRDFHATIVAAAGNAILDRLYATLRDRQLRMGAATIRLSEPGRMDQHRMRVTVDEHTAIARALADGDAALVDQLTVAHLDRADRLLRCADRRSA